jgi:hypothetical protein
MLFNLLLTLISINTFAQTPVESLTEDACPTVILDKNDGTADHIPVWNQRHQPACYSFTASMLASVWIREFWSQGNSQLANFIDNPKASYKSMKRSPQFNQILDADLGRTCQATNYILNEERNFSKDPTNPNYTQPKCNMYGFTKEEKTGNNLLKTPNEFNARMHELLQTGERPLPFAIEYCSATFRMPGKELIVNRTFHPSLSYLNETQPSQDNLSPNCGFHAAIVTGQEVRNGVCHYRIRNSTGDINRAGIDDGYYWIPARDLARNTLRVITLSHE